LPILPAGLPGVGCGLDVDQKLWAEERARLPDAMLALAVLTPKTLDSAAFSPQTDTAVGGWARIRREKEITNSEGATEENQNCQAAGKCSRRRWCLQTEAGRKRVFDAHTCNRWLGGWADKRTIHMSIRATGCWQLGSRKLTFGRGRMEYEGFLYTRGKPTIRGPWHEPVATRKGAPGQTDSLTICGHGNWQAALPRPRCWCWAGIASSIMGRGR